MDFLGGSIHDPCRDSCGQNLNNTQWVMEPWSHQHNNVSRVIVTLSKYFLCMLYYKSKIMYQIIEILSISCLRSWPFRFQKVPFFIFSSYQSNDMVDKLKSERRVEILWLAAGKHFILHLFSLNSFVRKTFSIAEKFFCDLPLRL